MAINCTVPFTLKMTDSNFQSLIVLSLCPVAVGTLEFYLQSEVEVPKRHFSKGATLKDTS